MAKDSDYNCELHLIHCGGIEGWIAFRDAGGHIGEYTSVMDNYVLQMCIFNDMIAGKNKENIMRIYNLSLGQFDLKVSQFKEFIKNHK